MKVSYQALMLIAIPATTLANGGPIDGSRIVGPGTVTFVQVEGVELRSEDLSFRIEGDTVEVEAVYVLESTSPSGTLDFAFPVDFVSDNQDINWNFDGESGPVPSEILSFSVSLNGTGLEAEASVTDTSEIVIDEYEYTLSTCWFTSSFELQAGATDTLRVACSFTPGFTDWAFSKSWMPLWGRRMFSYRLDPAGHWGDGIVDRFSMSVDVSDLVESQDFFQLPAGLSPDDEGLCTMSVEDLDMRAAEPLDFSYGRENQLSSRYVLDHRIGMDEISGITVSSSLPDDGGFSYGPSNLLDLDFDTAWCPGDDAGGTGSWIEIELDSCLVGEIYLVNGYTKSEEAYLGNSRIRSLRLTVWDDPGNPCRSYGGSEAVSGEVIDLEDIPWTRIDAGSFTGPGRLLFSTGDMGEPMGRIRIEVLGTYPGEACDDLCVSEIVIAGCTAREMEAW